MGYITIAVCKQFTLDVWDAVSVTSICTSAMRSWRHVASGVDFPWAGSNLYDKLFFCNALFQNITTTSAKKLHLNNTKF